MTPPGSTFGMPDAVRRNTQARAFAPTRQGAAHLTGAQKAAVIVRLVLAKGETLPLAELPEDLQTELTAQIAAMRLIDRSTLNAVAEEFIETIEQVGLAFNDGLQGALTLLGGQISDAAASRLRNLATQTDSTAPWARLENAPDDQILALLSNERAQIGAILLSKLSTPRAAELLSRLPGDRARKLALAVAQTDEIAPETVHRIGCALARQVDARPPRAFPNAPTRRVGAILDATSTKVRTEVLDGIERENAEFARAVRRVIFTYPDIPRRVEPLDVPRIVRMADQDVLANVLRATLDDPDSPEGAASAFLLKHCAQRMADGLRDEASTRRPLRPDALDEAMSRLVATIRTLAESGEITLTQPEATPAAP